MEALGSSSQVKAATGLGSEDELAVQPSEVQTQAFDGAPESMDLLAPMALSSSFMVYSGSPAYIQAGPGVEIVTFSKLSQAKEVVGPDVDTIYFQKEVIGGITYLTPLKAVRPKEVSYSNLNDNQLQFLAKGPAVAYSGSMPTATDFLKLHSSEQKALIELHGTLKTTPNTSSAGGTVSYLELNLPASGDTAAATIVLSQNANKVFVVEKLQARDYALMSYEDQLAISKTSAFDAAKEVLGLTGTQAQALAAINNAIAYIKGKFPDNATTTTVQIAGANPADPVEILNGRIGYFTLEQRNLFLEQLELVRDEVMNDMAVFNLTPLNDKITAIKDRFTRVFEFGNLPVRAPNIDDPSYAVAFSATGVYYGIIPGYQYMMDSNGNKTIKEGFDLFIAQEKIYFETAKSRRELIKNIRNDNMTIDAPSLLYRLQIMYNATSQADISCASEELRQQNDLLNSYVKVQKRISDQTAKNADTRYYGWLMQVPANGRDYNYQSIGGPYWHNWYVTNDDTILSDIAMFQKSNGAPDFAPIPHPIEKLRSITRPTIGLVRPGDGATYKLKNGEWQAYGNQLTETVNLIGQETQNSLNRISGFEKDKSRYTEMASNTLSKLNDMIISIGRSL